MGVVADVAVEVGDYVLEVGEVGKELDVGEGGEEG